jgi:hypothetical protein
MQSLVHKYFVLHHQIVLPGIGSLQIIPQTSSIDVANKLYPPINNFVFNSETTLLADKTFYHFLAKELEVEQIEAIKKFHEYIYEIKATASEGNVIQFNGIGIISKQADGTFTFQQEKSVFDFFPTIQLPEKPNTSVHKELADSTISDASEIQHDKWWIFAIVLAVVALAAILIKLNIA